MITIKDILAWNPCPEYTEERIADLVPSGEITPQGICDLNIPAEDKIWSLLHQHNDLFTDLELHSLACDFAEQALALIDNPDERSINAIRVKRDWIIGEATDDELSAAWSAACDAAKAATWDAAKAATWAAAKAVDRAAAKAVDRAAAKAVDRAAQLKHIMQKLQEKAWKRK